MIKDSTRQEVLAETLKMYTHLRNSVNIKYTAEVSYLTSNEDIFNVPRTDDQLLFFINRNLNHYQLISQYIKILQKINVTIKSIEDGTFDTNEIQNFIIQ